MTLFYNYFWLVNFHATFEVFNTNTDYQQWWAIKYIIVHVPTHDYSYYGWIWLRWLNFNKYELLTIVCSTSNEKKRFCFFLFKDRKYMPILMSMRLTFQLGYKLHVKLPSSNHLLYLLWYANFSSPSYLFFPIMLLHILLIFYLIKVESILR